MNKLITHIRWFLIVIPLGLWALITAPLIYPIAQLIEFILPKYNPLWVYMDDEIEHDYSNADFKAFRTDKPKWLRYYLWHGLRNTMWNLKVLLKPEKAREHCVWNNEVIVEIKQDSLTRNGEKVSVRGYCLEMAGLKFITKDGQEGWHVFSGDRISFKYSTFGTSELWYLANDRLYYRYSTVRKVYKWWVYFAMGTTDKRHLLNFKIYRYEQNQTTV